MLSPADRIRLIQEAKAIPITSKHSGHHERSALSDRNARTALAVLIKFGDEEAKETVLKVFRSDDPRLRMRAYYTIIQASDPRLILDLEPDLFTDESTADQFHREGIYSPRSVFSAMAIRKIIVSSGEFPEPVMTWAETLNKRFDSEFRRASVRQFVEQNRDLLKSGNFAATKPPTEVGITPDSRPPAKVYPPKPTPTPIPHPPGLAPI